MQDNNIQVLLHWMGRARYGRRFGRSRLQIEFVILIENNIGACSSYGRSLLKELIPIVSLFLKVSAKMRPLRRSGKDEKCKICN
nr:hypothetical protein CFP56_47028 [Quercus suber]